jgi:hypothetical protein
MRMDFGGYGFINKRGSTVSVIKGSMELIK